jgi:serine/threonine protein kinase
MDKLTDEEIGFINQSICKNPSRYNLQAGRFHFSNSDLEEIIKTVQTDLGTDTSKKIPAHGGFKLLGSRLFYPVIYSEVGTSDAVKYTLLCQSEEGGRGNIYLLNLPAKRLIIKAYQTHTEKEIARIASENGFGPTTYESEIELVEDYLPKLAISHKSKRKIGYQIGKIIRKCHNKNVIHSDLNETHIKFDTLTGEVKLIDFGVSHLFDNEGRIKRKEVAFDNALSFLMEPEIPPKDRKGIEAYYQKDSDEYKLPLATLKINEKDCFIELIHKWGFRYSLFSHFDEKRFIKSINEGYAI